MRIGIFGGTFDPPHLGHLVLAERCREDARLDEVWFLPSFDPPHKDRVSRFDHRCDMVALATTGQPAFKVDPIERDLPPPSYTARTLAELRARHPGSEFALILGADSLDDLPGWHRPQRVVEQAELVVAPRPGEPLMAADQLATRLGVDQVRMTAVECPLIGIASRDVRQRVADGKSIRFLVPRAVEEYVRERKLYQG